MVQSESFLYMLDIAGVSITIGSLALVVQSSSILIRPVRRGLLNLMWGLSIISVSFFWDLFSRRLGYLPYPDAQILLLVVGMILFFVASLRLFKVHKGRE